MSEQLTTIFNVIILITVHIIMLIVFVTIEKALINTIRKSIDYIRQYSKTNTNAKKDNFVNFNFNLELLVGTLLLQYLIIWIAFWYLTIFKLFPYDLLITINYSIKPLIMNFLFFVGLQLIIVLTVVLYWKVWKKKANEHYENSNGNKTD